MPQVTIVLPAYNIAPYLAAALRSVRRQTFADWELLLVDDGSTDATPEIAARHAAADERIRVLRSEHRGLLSALNLGLTAAQGELIARMDGDDLMHRDRLQEQVAYLTAHPEVGVVGCLIRCFPRRVLREGMQRYEAWLNSLITHEDIVRDLFVEAPFAHPSVMLRRDVVERVGGYQEHGWPEDYDLWMRLWLAGVRFGKVPRLLHFWREREDRLTRTDRRYAVRQFRELKIHYLKQSFLRGRETVQLWGAGRGGKEWARHLERRGLKVTRYVDIDLRKIGNLVRGAAVIAPAELPRYRGEPLLVTVGVKGARELIRERLTELGWVEGQDYVCVA
ncbi:MAG TPA: glycosyltransferase [Armatimonadetes bacterium]|nr:glycosyltransferase [Armatimonadota bacterium]